MIPINKLLRMERGTMETYLLEPRDNGAFLKKLSTYVSRIHAKVDTRQAIVVFLDNDSMQRMVIVKVLKSGRKMRKRGRIRGGHAAKN